MVTRQMGHVHASVASCGRVWACRLAQRKDALVSSKQICKKTFAIISIFRPASSFPQRHQISLQNGQLGKKIFFSVEFFVHPNTAISAWGVAARVRRVCKHTVLQAAFRKAPKKKSEKVNPRIHK